MTKKQKKSMLIGSLLAVVVLMAIAYSAFASNLTITGTGSVSSNWCIGFDSTRTSDYTATAGISGGTVPTGSMAFSGDACGSNYKTTASLNASFKQPGDKIEYTLTIGNKGTLAAAIESINIDGSSVTSDTTITKGNIKYIIEMPESTSLAVNATTTMKVTAMFQNDIEVSGSTNEQQTISISINAVQDDGNGGFTPTTSTFDGTGTIYRWNVANVVNGDGIRGFKIKNSAGNGPSDLYNTYDECINGMTNTYHIPDNAGYNCEDITIEYTLNPLTLNKQYYLKHDVVDNIITASYVCFIYNNIEHCMKGGVDESQAGTKPIFDENTQIIRDYQTFYNLGEFSNDTGCYYDPNGSYCTSGSFNRIESDLNGYIYVYGSSTEMCRVYYDGHSYCNHQ